MHTEIVTVAGQQYHKATWPSRLGARLLDLVLVITVCEIAGERFSALTLSLSIIYMLIGNALCRGASLGKRIVGLKIIDAQHGTPCSVIQDLVRHRYFLFSSPIGLLLAAHDSAQGHFEKPELYVVRTAPPTPEQREAVREKPAKLDLAGMRATLLRNRGDKNDANPLG